MFSFYLNTFLLRMIEFDQTVADPLYWVCFISLKSYLWFMFDLYKKIKPYKWNKLTKRLMVLCFISWMLFYLLFFFRLMPILLTSWCHWVVREGIGGVNLIEEISMKPLESMYHFHLKQPFYNIILFHCKKWYYLFNTIINFEFFTFFISLWFKKFIILFKVVNFIVPLFLIYF